MRFVVSGIVIMTSKGNKANGSAIYVYLSITLMGRNGEILLVSYSYKVHNLSVVLSVRRSVVFSTSSTMYNGYAFNRTICGDGGGRGLCLVTTPFSARGRLDPSIFARLIGSMGSDFSFILVSSPTKVNSNFRATTTPTSETLVIAGTRPANIHNTIGIEEGLRSVKGAGVQLIVGHFSQGLFARLNFCRSLSDIVSTARARLVTLIPFSVHVSIVIRQNITKLG